MRKNAGVVIFGITDGKKCEDICKYAPPKNKWPCVDCDTRYHDRAEPKEEVVKLVNQLMTEDDIQVIFQNKEG